MRKLGARRTRFCGLPNHILRLRVPESAANRTRFSAIGEPLSAGISSVIHRLVHKRIGKSVPVSAADGSFRAFEGSQTRFRRVFRPPSLRRNGFALMASGWATVMAYPFLRPPSAPPYPYLRPSIRRPMGTWPAPVSAAYLFLREP